MSEEIPIANPPLTAEEQSAVAKLTDADLLIIDVAILANCSNHWFKVARVMTRTEDALRSRYPNLSYSSTLNGYQNWWKRDALNHKAIFNICDSARFEYR